MNTFFLLILLAAQQPASDGVEQPPEAVVEHLIKDVRTGNDAEKLQAIEKFERLSIAVRNSEQQLLALFLDGDQAENVRVKAMQAYFQTVGTQRALESLSRLVPPSGDRFSKLSTIAKNAKESPEIRGFAMAELALLARSRESVAAGQPILDVIKDKAAPPDVRMAAAMSLINIGAFPL